MLSPATMASPGHRHRYPDELITLLAAQAREPSAALKQAKDAGFWHVILDGKIILCDRCKEPAVSVKGEVIDGWYAGKAHTHGGNVQAVRAPDRFPAVDLRSRAQARCTT